LNVDDEEYFPHVCVLGWLVEFEAMHKWADKHNKAVRNRDENFKRQYFWSAIARRLPRVCLNISEIEFDDHSRLCIAITANRTQEELDRAKDVKLIEKVRKILDETDPPEWYFAAS
jgi:hypothetical protein